MFGKIINNKLIKAPSKFIANGRIIVNFDKDIEKMKYYGFKEIVDSPPEVQKNEVYYVIEYKDYEEYIEVKYGINKTESINNEHILKDLVKAILRCDMLTLAHYAYPEDFE